jgi:hypothetical protein
VPFERSWPAYAASLRPGVRRAGPPKAERGADAGRGAAGAALSTPGMGDRLGVKVPWRKRWC